MLVNAFTGALVLSLLSWTLPSVGWADERPPLILEQTVPLADVSGRIDHMAVDLIRQRLFVAELGNGTLDVIDLATGSTVRRIAGLKEPQGVGYSSAADLLVVASAQDGSVRLFRGGDFSPAGIIDLGSDADNIRVDRRSGGVFVGYGSGGIAALDPSGRVIARRVKLAAHPESFQLESGGQRAIVNVPDAGQIAVLDLVAEHQTATWHVPGLRSNFAMALDEQSGRVAVVFRNPARLAVLGSQDGAVLSNMATCRDADDVFFDTRRSRIYVSCGEGIVDVLQEQADGYHQLGKIITKSGARTSLFVPELDRLFVAAREGIFGFGSGAAILVYRPSP